MQKNKLIFTLIFIVSFCALMFLAIADTATTQANVGNSVPVASSVAIALGNLNAGKIQLVSNQTRQINISATVTDDNGCTDIAGVNATLFRTNITGGSTAANNNRSHYSMSCTVRADCSGDADVAATYDCNLNVTWYLDPTDAGSAYADTNWTVNVTPYDGNGIGTSGTAVYDLNTLTSLSLQTTNINFGALSLGANTTTTNQNATISNLGNEAFDLSLTGYAVASGDNYSMNCTIGYVPIHLLEYQSSSFTYGAGVDLSNTSTELDFDLDRGNETTLRPEDDLFFGLAFPSEGVGGSCSGTVVVVATSDPGLD